MLTTPVRPIYTLFCLYKRKLRRDAQSTVSRVGRKPGSPLVTHAVCAIAVAGSTDSAPTDIRNVRLSRLFMNSPHAPVPTARNLSVYICNVKKLRFRLTLRGISNDRYLRLTGFANTRENLQKQMRRSCNRDR